MCTRARPVEFRSSSGESQRHFYSSLTGFVMMDCGDQCIKYILFFFNFIFVLCGLGLLIPGIIFGIEFKQLHDIKNEVTSTVNVPSTALIIIGATIFVIAFFGCCGALRESHCMVTTYAVLLLTILVIEVAVGIVAFYGLKNIDQKTLGKPYEESFKKYWEDPKFIDFVQENLKCCGVESQNDYSKLNGTIPWSCCKQEDLNHKHICNGHSDIFTAGCVDKLTDFLARLVKWIGSIALGVAAVEFVGVIFALCLANSIKNAERRAYRV